MISKILGLPNASFSKLSSYSLHYTISCLLFNIHKTVRALFENNQYVFIPLLYKINSDHFLVLPLPFMLYTISSELQAAVLKGNQILKSQGILFIQKLITIYENLIAEFKTRVQSDILDIRLKNECMQNYSGKLLIFDRISVFQ